MFYLVAQNEQGSPVVLGPLSDYASDELYAEVESWGWTVLTGSARKMSVAQARKEAREAQKENR